MKEVDIENWNRKEHYEFFSKMMNPMFGIVAEVDCTVAYEKSHAEKSSFFALYLHKSMIAANSVKELRYRIVNEKIVIFDKIHAGTTIARTDETFGFAFIPFNRNFEAFAADLQSEIQNVESSSGLRLNNDDIKKDLIRHSTFPWHSFTAILHPTNFDRTESVPKITFGKFLIRDNRKYLPISIEAHHGLVDGLHIAQYLEEFQKQLGQN